MYTIEVITKRCKSCGLCADYCPKKVYDFKTGHPPVPARAKDCIGCGICTTKCPDFALEVKEAKE